MHLESEMELYRRAPDRKKVLIVEDDLTIQPVLEKLIRKINPNVDIEWTTRAEDAFVLLADSQAKASSGRARLNYLDRPYEVVLLDIGLAGEKSGIDLVHDCEETKVSANFILTSGTAPVGDTLPFLPKPLRFHDVERIMGPFLRVAAAIREEMFIPSPVRFNHTGQKFEQGMTMFSAAFLAWLFIQVTLQLLPSFDFEPTSLAEESLIESNVNKLIPWDLTGGIPSATHLDPTRN